MKAANQKYGKKGKLENRHRCQEIHPGVSKSPRFSIQPSGNFEGVICRLTKDFAL